MNDFSGTGSAGRPVAASTGGGAPRMSLQGEERKGKGRGGWTSDGGSGRKLGARALKRRDGARAGREPPSGHRFRGQNVRGWAVGRRQPDDDLGLLRRPPSRRGAGWAGAVPGDAGERIVDVIDCARPVRRGTERQDLLLGGWEQALSDGEAEMSAAAAAAGRP